MEKVIELNSDEEFVKLAGVCDRNIRFISKEFNVDISARGKVVRIKAKNDREAENVEKLLEGLLSVVRGGGELSQQDLSFAVRSFKGLKEKKLSEIYLDKIEVWSKHKSVSPRTEGQKIYVDAMRKNDITFGIGPAGTGKTYLAMAMAVSCLKQGSVRRMILTRPAVEAGENLGFLPGDMHEKVSPYLRPLYDALYDMMDVVKIQEFIEKGIIEVVPLAFMRGRTLNESFIILDEAQNSTPEQMKMFLTRIGFDSKAVITGDITQSDLPQGRESGLKHVQGVLSGIEGISFVGFSGRDVVRHELVQSIIEAYAKKENKK